MTDTLHQVADNLLAIEAELRRLGLWEQEPPSAEALASEAPFCHDSLLFHQWLQWVLLPRMKQTVEEDSGWPANSDVHPLAEFTFERMPQDTDRLLALIGEFDDLIRKQAGGARRRIPVEVER